MKYNIKGLTKDGFTCRCGNDAPVHSMPDPGCRESGGDALAITALWFRWRQTILIAALVALVFPTLGYPGSAQHYLPAGAIDPTTILLPPPGDDSAAGQADLETVLHVQEDRTPSQIARAERVAHHTAFKMGASVMGSWFTPKNLPRTAEILEQVRRERQPLLAQAKRCWNRVRPYLRDARVQPCIKLPPDSSYPSGHSASAAVWAELFSAAFPEWKADFEAQVRETMWCRVLAGVHYPSDTTAGRQLGEEIGRAMLRTEAMRRAIREMRIEAAPFLPSAVTSVGP